MRKTTSQQTNSTKRREYTTFSVWQYYVPFIAGGRVETSVELSCEQGKKHVRRLLRLMLGLRKCPKNTLIFPANSLGAGLLRERRVEEGLREINGP